MFIDEKCIIDHKKLSPMAIVCINNLEKYYKENDGFSFNNELDQLETLWKTGELYDEDLILRRYGLRW